MENKISLISKALLVVAAVALVISLFVPIWSISLDAPQYPEGLGLKIWANKLAGDVDIINGLNHYIGMKTLHTDDFIEFKVLPYIIGIYAALFVLTAIIARKKMLYTILALFVLFGVLAMVDFWKWEYDYGHNLDPNAAIKVPGMAYQPPLIGFKQLLNFGAYSIPALGGWLFIGAGLLLVIAVLIETKVFSKFKKGGAVAVLAALSLSVVACGSNGPEAINLHKDACANCKMSISEGRFAAEIITQKGRVYKFDDVSCLNGYVANHNAKDIAKYYVGNFLAENELIDATQAWYVQSEEIASPMGGGTAAFSAKTAAEKLAAEHQTTVKSWADINVSSTHNSEHHH